MRVVGTAGHVDHGKSTLVRALSGIDPDRLKEEKARGMTIDLGFAWVDLHLPDSRRESVGIVDVPGHIDFIKNMLAGVGGIDAAILVVAADEGVMPQTREHLAILDLLAAPACIVAMTKVDVVDEPEWLDLVELDIAALLEDTRFAENELGAQIVRVSAATGAGMDDLRAALAQALTVLPPRRNRNRPRLPVDRVFTLSGFGAVVTGTLLDGELKSGDEVQIYPDNRRARIRGMQSHKQTVDRAAPGSRVALNLAGVAAADLRRGDVVAWPDSMTPATLLDVQFQLLEGAVQPLRHNQTYDLFCGASERQVTVRLIGAEQLAPGEEGFLQLRLDRPLVAAAGDRFILRRPSPSTTVGGGRVLHTAPGRRWKRFLPDVRARFERLARGAPDELLLSVIATTPFLTPADVIERASLDVAAGTEVLGELETQGALGRIGVGDRVLLYPLELEQQLRTALQDRLTQFHDQNPLRRGLPQAEARTYLAALAGRELKARLAAALLEQWQAVGYIRLDDSAVALADFVPMPRPEQAARVDKALAAFAANPYSPPNEADTRGLLGEDDELLGYLLDQGTLVALGQGVLMRPVDFARAIAAVVELLQGHESVTLAMVRDRLSTSRRYAQAILEEMDARRMTRRDGDGRTLRSLDAAQPFLDAAADGDG